MKIFLILNPKYVFSVHVCTYVRTLVHIRSVSAYGVLAYVSGSVCGCESFAEKTPDL